MILHAYKKRRRDNLSMRLAYDTRVDGLRPLTSRNLRKLRVVPQKSHRNFWNPKKCNIFTHTYMYIKYPHTYINKYNIIP